MRLIDADALTTELSAAKARFDIGDYAEKDVITNGATIISAVHEFFVKTIAEAHTVDAAPEWISVEDRLPKENQELIATNGKMSICARYDTKYNQFVQGHLDLTRHTTHWMPLPQPPKED